MTEAQEIERERYLSGIFDEQLQEQLRKARCYVEDYPGDDYYVRNLAIVLNEIEYRGLVPQY